MKVVDLSIPFILPISDDCGNCNDIVIQPLSFPPPVCLVHVKSITLFRLSLASGHYYN